jgi:catechol 2,3-dioxygenase-like lactoylglutathione lyase family enzyme
MAPLPSIRRLEHWTLVASDVERSKRWYVEVLGAEVPQRDGPTCVALAGTLIDMFPAGTESPAGLPFGVPSPGSIGQHHAYIIGLEDYDSWVAHFERLGQKYRRTAHGLGYMSIYVDDPDGYHIELTVPFDDNAQARSEIEKRGLLPEAMRFESWMEPQRSST